MKFCPTCETRYDEEILRFCTKDGAPLVDENQPNFTEMPSDSPAAADDPGADTMVRYKPPMDLADPEPSPEIDRSEAPRIVIPMTDQSREQQNVRSRGIPPYQPLPQKSNTAKVVALTVLGTLTLIAFGLGLFWLLGSEDPSKNKNAINVNTNPPDLNINNPNLGGVNYNFPTSTNSSLNTNFNTNINANMKTPTPKPSPNANANVNSVVNANVGNVMTNGAPPPTPNPTVTTPSPTPGATPKVSPTPDRSGRPPANSREK